MNYTKLLLPTIALAAALLACPAKLLAQPVGTYQEIFVTRDLTSATSTDIAAYNSFVTSEADLNPALPAGVTWTAVVSTASVQAIDNAPTGFDLGLPDRPVYNTAGQLVAGGGESIYLGYLFYSPVGYDQFGASVNTNVWTGSTAYGEARTGNTMGSGFVGVGTSQSTTATWLAGDLTGSTGVGGPVYLPLYALSGWITSAVAGGGPTVVGGAEITYGGTSTGSFTNNYLTETTQAGVEAALNMIGAGPITFGLAGQNPDGSFAPGTGAQLWELHFTGAFTDGSTVTVHYDPTLIGGVSPSSLQIYHYTGGSWVPVANERIDPVADTITFTTNSFSPFVLGVPEPSSILLGLFGAVGFSAVAIRNRRRK